MTLFFKYKPVEIEQKIKIFKPLIPITINGKEKLDLLGILDSGSDVTIIPEEIAKVLGVDYSKTIHELFTITGDAVLCKKCKVKIRLGSFREFYDLEIPALVPEKAGLDLVIGRLGLFPEFKITFIESQRRIELKKVEVSKLTFNIK